MLLIAAPGQGAQVPGFLSPWLDLPGFGDRLAEWSALAGCDLVKYGTAADAEEIRDTAIAQPLLVAAGLAAAEVILGGLGQASRLAAATAGHSVGELAAGPIAGVITPEDALRLVSVRGRAMASAAAAEPTGMTAVLGGDERGVLKSIEAHGLTPANVNGAGQIVAAATPAQLAAFAAHPPTGARLRPLSVAGAFHTRHMAPAVDALRSAAAAVTAADPALAMLSNRDGSVVRSGADWLERIITQVGAPVRWDMCMKTMSGLGVTALIELPPAESSAGAERGRVEMRGGSHLVAPPFPATIIEWLVEDGDPVSAGQPLVRLQPGGSEGKAKSACDSPKAHRPRRSSRSAVISLPGWSPTRSSPPVSTPPTSGSAAGSESPAAGSPDPTRASLTC